ncbi:MAG: hypothetical protein COZ18_08475 [Flexibacter sp. CG_4_10_14_3_um_filter_32_15]|nr:MAG: hypothetical protein COZ18_08475 [Flexibacter sp. CG_4_10_14_3_um_filter_32_15]
MKNHNLVALIFVLLVVLFFGSSFSSFVFAQERGQMQRIGCICRDGVRQNTTGAGACSGHKGVKYWLYAEVSIYQQYANDLPAIPDSDLIQLTPEEAKRIAKSIAKEVTETLPILYDGDKKEGDNENSLVEKEREELEKLREDNRKQRGVVSSPSNRFEVLDFFIPFVMVLVVILLFLLIVMVIKKVL